MFGKVKEGEDKLSSLLAMRAESANLDAPILTKRFSSSPNPRELGVKIIRVREGTIQPGADQKRPSLGDVNGLEGLSRRLSPGS